MGKYDQDQIVFEDKNEQYGFVQIPTVVMTSTVLSPAAVRIYGILRRYASMPEGAMPSVATICVEAQISKSTYSREIKKFIRSSENPNPPTPLVTAIHRKNKTNVFKIHKLTDQLIEKLKPTVMMEETELKKMKEKYKKKKSKNNQKGGSQIETPIENTRESQIDTPQSGFQIETPNTPSGVSNRDPNYIDNKLYRQQQTKNVVVVEAQKKFEKLFDKTLSTKKAEEFAKMAEENGKDLIECIERTKKYLNTQENVKNPVGALRYEITNGWDIEEESEKEDPIEKEKRRKENHEVMQSIEEMLKQEDQALLNMAEEEEISLDQLLQKVGGDF
jgi:hypothetical protein